MSPCFLSFFKMLWCWFIQLKASSENYCQLQEISLSDHFAITVKSKQHGSVGTLLCPSLRSYFWKWRKLHDFRLLISLFISRTLKIHPSKQWALWNSQDQIIVPFLWEFWMKLNFGFKVFKASFAHLLSAIVGFLWQKENLSTHFRPFIQSEPCMARTETAK